VSERGWSKQVTVRFAQCDPAGIVYFASHFDMLNSVVEDWFMEALGLPYYEIVGKRRIGLGYAHAASDFRRPARMGDALDYRVTVERVGTKSLRLRVTAATAGTEVLTAALVIVTTDLDTAASIPIPVDIRTAALAFQEGQ
jgi:acyl-CoA thioesterase FadM